MLWRPAHDGAATGPAVRADVVVRLRLSAAELLWRVARWALGLAGAVVVLWIGLVFLATPASAAVVVVATILEIVTRD